MRFNLTNDARPASSIDSARNEPRQLVTDVVFSANESAVRSYPRAFPAIFARAKGELLYSQEGKRYIDFFAGAGSLNYGHNPEEVKRSLIAYLEGDGLTHGLDFQTTAKGHFLDVFRSHILAPRGLDYRVQFCSPSGTNAVEAALKLARLKTGRTNVVSFTGGFHGMSTGALAVTGAEYFKQGLHATLAKTTTVPFPASPLGPFDSLELLRRLVEDPSSGVEKPAAILLETVQAEGGIFEAPTEFLRGLRRFCDVHGVLLICDEIQVGCGRTGTFFSFEHAGIQPDLVPLAKSIGGYGLPMALLLIKPELDLWKPGQHNGTFRGNQLAFVAAAEVVKRHWADEVFAGEVRRKGALVADFLAEHVEDDLGLPVRGVGLIWGIDLGGVPGVTAGEVSRRCFERGLVIETCGRDDEVLKILPSLTIRQAYLLHGLKIIASVLHEALSGAAATTKVAGTI